MEYITLKDICKINMGQAPDSSSYNDNEEGMPFFQGNADFGERYPITRIWCSDPIKIAKPEDILISVRAPIGALNFAKEECCIGRGLAAITPDKSKVSLEFIYWFLKGKNTELNSKGTGSTFKAISRKVLEEIKVPNIDFEKQHEYAQVLEKVYGLIQMRKQELSALDDLIKARFVELFGNLKRNSKGWPIVAFTECAEIDTNMIHDFEGYENYPHIGIDSIEKETGRLSGYRTVVEDGVISGKYLFTEKHIIYSKIRPNLNKVAMPNFVGVCSADAYPILAKDGVCAKEYLAYTMRSKYFLDYILAFSNRTNLPKVNKKQVEGFALPLPPIDLQQQFAAFVAEVDKSKVVEITKWFYQEVICLSDIMKNQNCSDKKA